ncbi:histidine kinase [Thermoflavifilum thermophilum]|uniref:histidine kinase n=1 Tax=Thermoflavifilum thermophilum TaxID=1393122 RepID=UPI0015A5D441|nr:histidine kinase [Thermoflavifilum thermophilum]
MSESLPDRVVDIRSYTSILNDPKGAYSIEKIIHQYFLSPSNFHDLPWINSSVHDFWLKITIFNPGVQRDDIYWYVGYPDHAYFYSQQPDGSYGLTASAGLMEKGSGWNKWNRFAFLLHLPANTTSVFYLHIINKYDIENPLYSKLYPADAWNAFALQQNLLFTPLSRWVFFIAGLLTLIGVLAFIGYKRSHESIYVWVSVFSFAVMLYLFAQLGAYPFQFSLFAFWPVVQYVLYISGPVVCFYLPFAGLCKYMADMNLSSKKLQRIFQYVFIFISAIIILQAIFIATRHFHAARMIYILFFYFSLLPTVAFLWWLHPHRKNKSIQYFLIGSWILILTGVICFHAGILFTASLPSYGMNAFSLKILMIGSVASMLCFLMSAAHHEKKVQIKTIIRQQQLIQKMSEQIQTLNNELQQQVEFNVKKKQQIESIEKELYELRRMKLEAEYQLKLNELELKAIRAQMNPHFIFNCLNSIQLFIMQKHDELAQEYLSDFSLLIRQTLEMSRLNFVSLEEEIQYLQTYLRLEKMRFEERMDYEIRIDPKIDPDRTEIPTMLLQPYVENAVKHGINHPRHKGKILIHFEDKNDILVCSIEDNGMGIKRTRELGMDNFRKHLMAGMELSKMRAEWINKIFHTEIRIEVIDKEEKYGDMSGTLVRIWVPQT